MIQWHGTVEVEELKCPAQSLDRTRYIMNWMWSLLDILASVPDLSDALVAELNEHKSLPSWNAVVLE